MGGFARFRVDPKVRRVYSRPLEEDTVVSKEFSTNLVHRVESFKQFLGKVTHSAGGTPGLTALADEDCE